MSWRILDERDAAIVTEMGVGAVVFSRDDLMAVQVTGKHRTRFLHAVTTQDVNAMVSGDRRLNSLCTAQGELMGWWSQIAEDKQDVLWMPRGETDGLIKALLAYRVAERVRFSPTDDLGLLEVVGPKSSYFADSMGFSLDDLAATKGGEATIVRQWQGHELRLWSQPQAIGAGASSIDATMDSWAAQLPRAALAEVAAHLLSAGAQAGSQAAREVLRIRTGQPGSAARTASPKGSTPLELGLRAAVSLDKGCYLGHEALAMQAWRGKLRRHLAWLSVAGDETPAAGQQLRTMAGRRAGWTATGYRLPSGACLGLGLLQRRAYTPDVVIQIEDFASPVTVTRTTRAGVFEP